MCGIAGIFAYRDATPPVDAAELVRVRDHMAPRGPDGKGAWIAEDGRIGLAHRRLSIIDLSDAGAQPMSSANGGLVVTFNGEIYNYRVLRERLEERGYAFRSDSDTEVLLHLYAHKGAAMVEDLRGMFAFGLWDADKRALLLARDPYGIKPLYVADDGATIRFASQVKALIAGGAVSRETDLAGLAGFYLLGAVPEPFTVHRAVKALPRGATLRVATGGAREARSYFSIARLYRAAEDDSRGLAGKRDTQEDVRGAILDSVRHHLVADVPVGAFLSAGVDSGSLVGLMRDCGQGDIETVTLAYDEFSGRAENEAPLAEAVARHYGTRHTTRVVTKREFEADLPRILAAMDQPSIDGINTWFVSKAAREKGLKVAISGLGGDELFGGYSTFREVPRLVRWMAPPARVPLLGEGVRRVFSSLSRLSPAIKPKAAGLVKYGGDWRGAWLLRRALFMPWEIESLMGREAARTGLAELDPLGLIGRTLEPEPKSAFGRIACLESALYMGNQLLRDTDWASMAHGLEVRVPLVDGELVRRTAPLMVGHRRPDGKALLGNAPSLPLPERVIARPKTGFSMPFEQWMAGSGTFESSVKADGRKANTNSWARRWASHLAEAMA